MTDLTAEQTSILIAIKGSPGASAAELANIVHRRLQDVLRDAQQLVDAHLVERRHLRRKRSDGIEHSYSGLFLATAPASVDAALCPACGARRRHFETGPECRATAELRELGRALGWQRVPIGYGKAIQTGEALWDQFLNRADQASLMAGIRHAKEWVALGGQIRRDAVGAPS